MARYHHNNTNSKHINACKEYIYAHIKERITIKDLADALGVSASYLSRLFKKETGVSVSAYIRNRKIDMAKNLLRFSNDSMIEIANRLSFSSQSHFIQQFREVVGMTPKKYRDTYYMVEWNAEPSRSGRTAHPAASPTYDECTANAKKTPQGTSLLFRRPYPAAFVCPGFTGSGRCRFHPSAGPPGCSFRAASGR